MILKREHIVFKLLTFLVSIFVLTSCSILKIGPKKKALVVFSYRADFDTKEDLKITQDRITKLIHSLDDKGYDVTSFINKSKFKAKNSEELTNKNLRKEFSKLIQNSKRGDRVILFFRGVGSEGNKKEEIESDEALILNNLQVKGENFSESFFSMSEAHAVAKKLSEKGVKTLLANLSCFSGNSHFRSLWQEHQSYCTVTSSPHSYRSECIDFDDMDRFSDHFLNQANDGENVEDHFFKIRRKDKKYYSLPQISTFTVPYFEKIGNDLKTFDVGNLDSRNYMHHIKMGQDIEFLKYKELIDYDIQEVGTQYSKKFINLLRSMSKLLENIRTIKMKTANLASKNVKQVVLSSRYCIQCELKNWISDYFINFYECSLKYNKEYEEEFSECNDDMQFFEGLYLKKKMGFSFKEIINKKWLSKQTKEAYLRLIDRYEYHVKRVGKLEERLKEDFDKVINANKKIANLSNEFMGLERELYDYLLKERPKSKNENACANFIL